MIMTTITFESELDVKKTTFRDLEDFLSIISESYDFSYEEYLETKLQKIKSAPSSEFVSL